MPHSLAYIKLKQYRIKRLLKQLKLDITIKHVYLIVLNFKYDGLIAKHD